MNNYLSPLHLTKTGNTGTYGGAVSIDGTLGPVTAHFINCTFTKNVASVWGGAMLVKQGNAVIQSSQLVFNKATQGGAIALDSGANVSSIWTSYAGNLATQGGDDVYLSGRCGLELRGVHVVCAFVSVLGLHTQSL